MLRQDDARPARRPPRQLGGRARAALLTGLLAFAALQAGLTAAIERGLPQFRDPLYTHKADRLRERIAGPGPRPLTVVMLGSSRTTFAFKGADEEPRLAEDGGAPVVLYNFGLTGAGPLTELVTLRRLLADHLRPDLLLLEIHPCLLTSDVPRDLRRLTAGRIDRREIPLLTHYGASRAGLRRDWWLGAAVPWYTRRYAILSETVPALLPWELRQDAFRCVDRSGWFETPMAPRARELRGRAVQKAWLEYYDRLQTFRLGQGPCQALHEILKVCAREGIPAALVWLPEGPVFRSWYTPQAEAQTRAFLRHTCRTFGVPLIDAREWVPEEEFYDSHHVTTPGAERFMARLSREFLPPLLRPLARRRAGSADPATEQAP